MILCKKVEYYYLIDLKNSDLSTPIHNDLYFSNILLTDEEKVYFVDWEYASMGNKYFDLALFVCATDLSVENETELLLQYKDVNLYEYLNEKLVAYFFICTWAIAKNEIPINIKYFLTKLEDFYNLVVYLNNLNKKQIEQVLFLDLDGTTLNTHINERSSSTQKVRDFLGHLINLNTLYVPSTGRGLNWETKLIVDELGSKNYILGNGAQIVFNDVEIFAKPINSDVLDNISKQFRASGAVALINFKDTEISYCSNEEIKKQANFFYNLQFANNDFEIESKVFRMLIWHFKSNVSRKLFKTWSEKYQGQIHITKSGPNDNFIEITDAKVSKGITKKLFATLINNSKVKTVHIGDSMNDSTAVGQLDEVISMKNGSEKFKKLANIVSEFNNKDEGIINTIKKYCF